MAILYYNLLIKASSKDFQMKLMKFLQNSSKFSLLQSFIECEVLVVVPDQYDFEFSKTAAERKHQTEAQFIYRNLKLLITEKFQSHLKVTLGIWTIKPTWWNTFSKMERNIAIRFDLISNHLLGQILKVQQIV